MIRAGQRAHFTLYEQNCWLITDHITSSLCIAREEAGGGMG